MALDPGFYVARYHLGQALHSSGRPEAAVAESARRYVPNVAHAIVHAALADPGAALEWLEKDLDERSLYPPFYAFDPVFDELRDDRRFGELVRRVQRAKLDA